MHLLLSIYPNTPPPHSKSVITGLRPAFLDKRLSWVFTFFWAFFKIDFVTSIIASQTRLLFLFWQLKT